MYHQWYMYHRLGTHALNNLIDRTPAFKIIPMPLPSGAFDILIYTDKDQEVPQTWNETGPALMVDSQEVRLRSFSTVIHKVDAMVAYKKVAD